MQNTRLIQWAVGAGGRQRGGCIVWILQGYRMDIVWILSGDCLGNVWVYCIGLVLEICWFGRVRCQWIS